MAVHGLAVVLVDGVDLLLALALGRVDPRQADVLLLDGEVLAVPVVGRLGRELLQVVDAQLLVAGAELLGARLAAGQDLLDGVVRQLAGGSVGAVGQGAGGALGLEDVLSAVLDHGQQLVLVGGGLGGDLGAALLDDELVEAQLLGGALSTFSSMALSVTKR